MRRSGWLTFSAVVLIIAGIMRILDAVWAFRYKGTVVDDLHDAVFGHDLKTYGWIWLIVGAILIIAGFVVMTPGGVTAQISRWIGIAAAAVLAITAISWMAYYPVWSLLYIALAVAVIYGLSAHFEEQAVTRS